MLIDVDAPDPIDLPQPIRAFLNDTVGQNMGSGDRDPATALAGLPASMPAGQVMRLCEGGPFGWLLDARADRIDDRVALEVCENSRMAGMSHYRVWQDGSVERLASEESAIVFPAGASKDEEQRIEQAYFARNRAVQDLLTERGFR